MNKLQGKIFMVVGGVATATAISFIFSFTGVFIVKPLLFPSTSSPETTGSSNSENVREANTTETTQYDVKETKSQCIERVKNRLVERDRGKVVTHSDIENYYSEFNTRCDLQ